MVRGGLRRSAVSSDWLAFGGPTAVETRMRPLHQCAHDEFGLIASASDTI